MNESNKIKVWDRVVRIAHWGLAILVILNFIDEGGDQLHRYAGYAATGIVLIRIVWGFTGSRYARFSEWWPSPSRVIAYTRLKLKGEAQRYIGHNPLGAVMMLFLMALVLNQGITGYLLGTDRFFGEEWLENWHVLSANLFMVAVGLHVLGALAESWAHKENLPAAMVHGYKRDHETERTPET